ncbi:unnamed protein product [Miscanthus lutarioriparius]|uniref:Uncharacterized protein n=1 Tax=Miscanthus lutarioriparius TaxID=422564 RepID=A0A811PWP7_9POAL|nr:unnamed protein product [Miscanthus lutarioriparius]
MDSSASRADDVGDWVSTKRTAVAPFPERRERVGGGFGGDSHSRADDSSWVSNKSSSVPLPPPPADSKRGGPVWGFNRDGSADADSWCRREEMSNVGGSWADGNEDNKEKGEQIPKSKSSNPFCAARPREDVLAAKRPDWREEPKVDKLEIQPRARSSNPFGVARPREEVLAEKGEDWRKIDEKLEAMKAREALLERSFGWRGSPAVGEENGSAQLPVTRAKRAGKKPDAVAAANESEEGFDN